MIVMWIIFVTVLPADWNHKVEFVKRIEPLVTYCPCLLLLCLYGTAAQHGTIAGAAPDGRAALQQRQSRRQ